MRLIYETVGDNETIQARAKVRYYIGYVIYCDLAAQLGYISLIFSNHYEDNA